MQVAATTMETMAETAFAQIHCKCGAGPFDDRETWVAHVRDGMPQRKARKRRDFQAEEAEQQALESYIGSHGILPEENQEKERERL
jgi:hypothetical protein